MYIWQRRYFAFGVWYTVDDAQLENLDHLYHPNSPCNSSVEAYSQRDRKLCAMCTRSLRQRLCGSPERHNPVVVDP